MVTLLPEPDSPTMPRTSPSSSDRLMPSTACITPFCEGNSTERFSISNKAIRNLSALQLGVERVAQSVSEQIEGQHSDQNCEAGEGDHPPGAQDEFAGIGQHGAPFG